MACSNCGATGIHACIGFKPEPWTDEEKERLRTAIDNCLANPAELRKEIEELKRQLEESSNGALACANRILQQEQKIGALHQQLAESQAREARLRKLIPNRTPNGFVLFGQNYSEQEDKFNDPHNPMCKFKRIYLDACQEALALPHDDTALKEYRDAVITQFVGEFNRHVGGDGEFWLHELEDYLDNLKAKP